MRQLMTIGVAIFVGGIVWPFGFEMLNRGWPEYTMQQLYLRLGIAIITGGILALVATAGWLKFSWEQEKSHQLEEKLKVRTGKAKNNPGAN